MGNPVYSPITESIPQYEHKAVLSYLSSIQSIISFGLNIFRQKKNNRIFDHLLIFLYD